MELSGNEIKQLVDAIISAYPTKEHLEMIIYCGFEEHLDVIAGGNDLKILVFNLITKWAIPQGKIEDLIEKAYQDNRDNPKLKDFYHKLKPSIFNTGEISINNSQLITTEEWNNLYCILQQINNNQSITQICRQTLKIVKMTY